MQKSIIHHTVVDQMGLQVTLPVLPQRIISLVPSQTELLFSLGLDTEIVGLTRFCTHPADRVIDKQRIGGTKDFDIEKIHTLRPDLIIGNKEENYIKGIAELREYYPVWMSDIYTLSDAFDMMSAIGQITARLQQARFIITDIQNCFDALPIVNDPLSLATCAYFIWRKPYMVAATGTFIDHMMTLLGVVNSFADLSRYPQVTADQVADRQPDFIFLSSEPYSFTERHIAEFKEISPSSTVIIVDGELFSWYGSRLRYTADYLRELRIQVLSPLG